VVLSAQTDEQINKQTSTAISTCPDLDVPRTSCLYAHKLLFGTARVLLVTATNGGLRLKSAQIRVKKLRVPVVRLNYPTDDLLINTGNSSDRAEVPKIKLHLGGSATALRSK
jgi:hypothetical protein